jgi:hypothetical protein
MRKQAIVLPICFFILMSIVPFNTLKVESMAQANPDINEYTQKVCIQTRTLPDAVIVDLVFPTPTVTNTPLYDTVEITDMPKYGAPGAPVLPFKPIRVLVPQSKEVQSVNVIYGNRKCLEGRFNLQYGRTPVPTSYDKVVVDQPNPKIYSSANPFPGILFSKLSEQYLRGYEIVPLTLYPVQYIPKTGKLFYYETMTVTVSFQETGKTSPMFRDSPQDKILVLNTVDNPDVAETYTKTEPLMQPTHVNSSKSYDYVIITKNALNSSFQPLVNWKILKGLTATIVLVEDILSDPDYFCDGMFGDGCGSEFNGTAARIRNFVKDAYQNWGTEYVLLGGDVGIIPARGVYGFVDVENPPAPYTIDRHMPCDMYYGTLDGSWDNDNDTIFGEPVYIGSTNSPENGTAGEEADFFGEVYIGRATVDTPEEAENFVNKTLWYEQTTDDNYLKKAVMMGEKLDDQTYGSNNKDLVTDVIPQYTTTRLYNRDATFSATAVINSLNSGPHIVNHDGHANANFVMGLDLTDVDGLNNTEYFMAYSVGCEAVAFDGGGGDAIAEHFIFNPHGAFAFIGNTRYGWYSSGTSSGPGDKLDREFFSVVNNTANNLGKALQFSKENQFSTGMNDAKRWTYFVLVLLGDPETAIKTEIVAPTAGFSTVRSDQLLKPPALKGVAELEGTAKRGTAVGATFKNYTIEFGTGTHPTSWSTVGINLTDNGESEITTGVLATWNTSQVMAYQTYTLKLTVVDQYGRVGEDRWIVKVKPLPDLHVNPHVTNIHVGQTFKVDVGITKIEDLYELDIPLNWNVTQVDYVNHTVKIPVEDYSGGVLHQPVSITINEANQTAGTYHIASRSQYPASTFDGDGTIFEITFEAKAAGTCILNISSSRLLDRSSCSIKHRAVDGIVEIAPGVHDVAVTGISIEKTMFCQGLSVDANVTVENQGSFNEIFTVTTYANTTVINITQVSLPYYSQKAIIFTWNTTTVSLGNYILIAMANVLPEETDTADNTYVDGTVTIIEPSFDIAVLNVTSSKTIVGKGYLVIFNVTVENQADLISTFNVTLYADLNSTVIGDEVTIGTQNVTLAGGNVTIITFQWNTTDIAYGNYTITGYVPPLEAEADIADNTCVDGWVVVTIPGDFNGDYYVEIFDIVKICVAYNTRQGDLRYQPNLDIDGDGMIDIFDVVRACTHYNERVYP